METLPGRSIGSPCWLKDWWGLRSPPFGGFEIKPSLKGDGANRSGLGDTERSMLRLALQGRGGTLGMGAAEASLSALFDGRGGTAGVDCIVAAVLIAVLEE